MNKIFQYSAVAVFLGAGLGVAHAADLLSGTTLGGKMYFDTSDISQKLDGKQTGSDGYGFDVKRFYFSATHQFDQTWSINLTTDFHYSSSDGKSDIFVKKAYVQGDFAPLFVLRAGSADMPWIPYVEDLYGFRYVENTITDRFSLTNSADYGLHALGKQGIFDYQVSLVSGGGYSHVDDRSERPDLALRVGLHPFDGFTLAGGFYDGKRGEETATAAGPTNTQTLYDAVAAYVNHGVRLGGEYYYEKNPVKYSSSNLPALSTAPADAISNAKDTSNGYSLWGSYQILEPVTVFARYDRARLSKDVDPSLKDSYFNVGAQYAVRKGIVVSLVYKNEKLKDAIHEAKFDEIGIFSQIAF